MLLSQDKFNKRKLVWGITPDDNDSKDRDDATWVHRDAQTGIITAYISITDLSAYIEKGDAYERRARNMHWTKYHLNGIKGNNDNMLGREMAEETATLLPGRIHPAQTVIAKFDKDFNFVSASLEQTRCYIREHVPPEELAERLQPGGEYRLWGQLAYKINQNILKSHSFDTELEYFKESGIERTAVNSDECITNTSKLVEIYMLFANHINAEIRHKLDIKGLYRNHLNPQDKHRYDLGVYVEAKAENDSTSAHVLDLDIVGKQKSPHATRAFYSPELVSHTVIGHKSYEHATSPIRRYPDLINQLMVDAYFNNKPYPYSYEELKEIAHDCNVHAARDKQKKKASERKNNDEEYRRILIDNTTDTYCYLPSASSEQSDLLRIALEHNIENTEFRDSLTARLKKLSPVKELVTDKLLLQLVHSLPADSTFWQPVRDATVSYLSENPERGISLMHLSCLAHRDWNDYKVRERMHNGFVGRQICVNVKNISLSTETVTLMRKESAAAGENVSSFWRDYMNGNLVPDTQTVLRLQDSDEIIPAGTWNGENAEISFRKIAALMNWQYEYNYTKDDNTGVYFTDFYVWTGERNNPLISVSASGDDKAKSVRAAAYEILVSSEERGLIQKETSDLITDRKSAFRQNIASVAETAKSPVSEKLFAPVPERA